MSTGFNISKGKDAELWDRVEQSDPTNAVIVVMLLKVAEADATLEDYDTFSAILAGSNTEADATNYARVVLDDTDLSSAAAVNDTDDRMEVTTPAVLFSTLGGASNNSIVKAVFGYDSDSTGGTDANIVPLYAFDLSYTTTGVNFQINSGIIARTS
jgi:hypothetical protein